jgi:hypothetical protein
MDQPRALPFGRVSAGEGPLPRGPRIRLSDRFDETQPAKGPGEANRLPPAHRNRDPAVHPTSENRDPGQIQ